MEGLFFFLKSNQNSSAVRNNFIYMIQSVTRTTAVHWWYCICQEVQYRICSTKLCAQENPEKRHPFQCKQKIFI